MLSPLWLPTLCIRTLKLDHLPPYIMMAEVISCITRPELGTEICQSKGSLGEGVVVFFKWVVCDVRCRSWDQYQGHGFRYHIKLKWDMTTPCCRVVSRNVNQFLVKTHRFGTENKTMNETGARMVSTTKRTSARWGQQSGQELFAARSWGKASIENLNFLLNTERSLLTKGSNLAWWLNSITLVSLQSTIKSFAFY